MMMRLEGAGPLTSGARFEVIPGTSHLSCWEAPERTLPALRAFLAETLASPRASAAVSG